MTAGLMETARRGEDIVLTAAGAWTIQAARALDEGLGALKAAGAKKVLIVLEGRSASDAIGKKAAPVDAAIVGIVDTVDLPS